MAGAHPHEQTVAVVGLGYVGLPLALLAEKKGYFVTGIVRTQESADKINSKITPFKDASVESQLAASTLKATTDFSKIHDVSYIIICVPTPVDKNYLPDLTSVTTAVKEIGKNLKKRQIVILESTVNPGICEEVILPILERESGLAGGVDFHLVHCPERINPGDSKWNVENINRVIGSLDPEGLSKAISFYESILTGTITPMGSLKEAEACKVVENSFRDINIAFANEIALSFSKMGIDALRVINGAATKPFGFLAHYPGCGVGGHCIPVDPYYLIEYARTKGFTHHFLSLARTINNHMPIETVDILENGLKELNLNISEVHVTVLGLSYKGNIDDDRESPSYEIIDELKSRGANFVVFDPHLPNKSNTSSLEDAVSGSAAVVIATDHNEFKNLTPEFLNLHGVKVVVDGRNCLPKEEFANSRVLYKGIGR